MTTTPTPSEVADILRQSPYPLIAFDVDSLTILGANEAACELVGRDSRSLAGVATTDLMSPVDVRAAQETWALLLSGAMESYRGIRRIRRPDDSELMVNVWVRLVTIAGSRFGLAIAPEPGAVRWPIDANIRIALAVTDHDWTIEHVSNDIAHVLGCNPDTYRGSPLLGLLQPADAQDFMSALGRIAAGEGGTTLRTHLRAGGDRWQEVWCLVVAMCQHQPPRLGLAITAISDLGLKFASELHLPITILHSDVLGGIDRLRSQIPSGSLSTRQWEILARLVRGERAQEIASSLFLSPSTVRNHLSTIYRKFGVHSQAGLLAKLLEAPS